jgi:hypothetical protein
VIDLAGLDFLVVTPKLLEALKEMPTAAGYNDGLRAADFDSEDVVRERDFLARFTLYGLPL